MLVDELAHRRSQYALGRNVTMADADIDALIRASIRTSPTAFNSQGSRALILFGEHSEKVWRITSEVLREIVPDADWPKTEKRMAGFAAGYGTILFYEDQKVMREYQDKLPTFADQFPIWAEQSNGMAQFAVWAALAERNIGASLQHYNPLIDARVAAEWDLPETWRLRALMPFGSNEAPVAEKQVIADDLRFRTVGA